MAETVQASQQDGHFNESIVNEEILEDMKKNRIDHMKYLPDKETFRKQYLHVYTDLHCKLL